LNYTVVLDFTSNDTFYQSQYMTFDGESYNVVPGQQNLDSWVNVSKDAPAENIDITVTVVRGTDTYVSPTGNQLTNGDFETGNFEGWNVTGVCSISNTIVHSGSYSAYVSDQVYDSEISQEVMLPANRDISFDGYVYPLEVGQTCGPSGSSRICFIFCNKQSMATAFSISVCWSWNTLDYYDNGTALVELLVPFNASVWNHYSLNLTSLIESYFGGFDLSQIVLFSISIYYHYSSGSPGAFYLDNLNLSA